MFSYHVDRTHTYQGDIVTLVRLMDGTTTPITPDDSREVVDHSPNGFEMGYRGSGPSQLALAIVLDYLKIKAKTETPAPSAFRIIKRAHSVYIAFRDEFVASASVLLRVDDARIEEWLTEMVPALPQLERMWWGREPEEEAPQPGPGDQYVIGVDPATGKGDAVETMHVETRLPAGDRNEP